MGSLPSIITRRCAVCFQDIGALDYFVTGLWSAAKYEVPHQFLCADHLSPRLWPEARAVLAERNARHAAARARAELPASLTTCAVPQRRSTDLGAWAGAYEMDAFAVEYSAPPPDGTPVPWTKVGGRIFVFVIVQVRLDGCSAFLESRWSPATEFHTDVRLEVVDWRLPERPSELRDLMRGVEVVQAFARENPGPKGDYALTLDEFNERVPSLYWQYVDDHGRRPGQLELAKLFGTTFPTLRRRMDDRKRARMPWPPPRPLSSSR